MTAPSNRRKSRVVSTAEMKRARDADQASMMSFNSGSPSPTMYTQTSYESETIYSLPNAEKALEQALRHHQQRRNQPRLRGNPSMMSVASRELDSRPPSSPAPVFAPVIASIPPRQVVTPPSTALDLSIASFEVLIREIEQEEEERKRKRSSPPPPSVPANLPALDMVPSPLTSPETPLVLPPLVARPRPRRADPHHEAKRRSTGSILFSQLTPTFGDETASGIWTDRKFSTTSIMDRRLSMTSFTEEGSKRHSAREITFNFVDWSGFPSRCSVTEGSNVGLGRSDSVVSSFFGESRRDSTYNYRRRGSVF
jgi:hypothetical protein